jgi:hypothetical protein
LQKKMQQLENDLDQTQEKLMNANQRLEEKEKALQNVSLPPRVILIPFSCLFLRQRRKWRLWTRRCSSSKTSSRTPRPIWRRPRTTLRKRRRRCRTYVTKSSLETRVRVYHTLLPERLILSGRFLANPVLFIYIPLRMHAPVGRIHLKRMQPTISLV